MISLSINRNQEAGTLVFNSVAYVLCAVRSSSHDVIPAPGVGLFLYNVYVQLHRAK